MKKQLTFEDEEGERHLRELLDSLHRSAAQAKVEEYQNRMRSMLQQCPGFIEGDMPSSEQGRGSVVIEGAQATAAYDWLKRRFVCSQSLEFDLAAGGIRIEIAPRPRNHGRTKRRLKITFGKPEQYELDI